MAVIIRLVVFRVSKITSTLALIIFSNLCYFKCCSLDIWEKQGRVRQVNVSQYISFMSNRVLGFKEEYSFRTGDNTPLDLDSMRYR